MKSLSSCLPVRFAALVLAGVLLATLASGCFAVLVGAGAGATVAYVRGDLDTTLDANFAHSVKAATNALDDLKYAKVSVHQDALQASLIYRTSADQKIELYLEKATDASTKLKIRVGTFGQESLQQEILTRLKAAL